MKLFDKFKKNKITKPVNKPVEEQIPQPDIQDVFAQNLKYISQTGINCDVIDRQFVKNNTRYHLTIGEIDCPTGRIIVSDPLCYLRMGKYCPILDKAIPIGKYPVEVAICRNEYTGIRMCTARMKIKNTKAVKYECAMPTEDSAVSKAADGLITGFPVEAGMMSFCDVQVANEYNDFLNKWYAQNEGKNHYDDYFAEFFKESDRKLPQYQREGGDFIEWTNPDTGNKLVMIASGFGDGFYQSYWGYDNNSEICELIVPMVNPDLFDN